MDTKKHSNPYLVYILSILHRQNSAIRFDSIPNSHIMFCYRVKDVFRSFLSSINMFYIYIYCRKFIAENQQTNKNIRSPCPFLRFVLLNTPLPIIKSGHSLLIIMDYWKGRTTLWEKQTDSELSRLFRFNCVRLVVHGKNKSTYLTLSLCCLRPSCRNLFYSTYTCSCGTCWLVFLPRAMTNETQENTNYRNIYVSVLYMMILPNFWLPNQVPHNSLLTTKSGPTQLTFNHQFRSHTTHFWPPIQVPHNSLLTTNSGPTQRTFDRQFRSHTTHF